MHRMTSDLLSTRDVAERKNVTTTTVARWVAAGRLTPVLRLPGIRGAMFFTPADVAALDDEPEAAARHRVLQRVTAHARTHTIASVKQTANTAQAAISLRVNSSAPASRMRRAARGTAP